jgi:hypothetical protein
MFYRYIAWVYTNIIKSSLHPVESEDIKYYYI